MSTAIVSDEVMREPRSALVSLVECGKLMREYGFQIGTEALTEGIQQGKFPFAIAIKIKEWRYYISRKKLMQFLVDWCGEVA